MDPLGGSECSGETPPNRPNELCKILPDPPRYIWTDGITPKDCRKRWGHLVVKVARRALKDYSSQCVLHLGFMISDRYPSINETWPLSRSTFGAARWWQNYGPNVSPSSPTITKRSRSVVASATFSRQPLGVHTVRPNIAGRIW